MKSKKFYALIGTAALAVVMAASNLQVVWAQTSPIKVNSSGVILSPKVGIGNPSPQYSLDVNGDIVLTGYVVHISDARLKTNVSDLRIAGSLFEKLRPVTYNMKPADVSKYYELLPDSVTIRNDDELRRYFGIGEIDEHRKRMGFIAQEVKEIYPELVHEDDEGMLGVDYVSLIPVLVGVVQEQNETLRALNETIWAQNETIQALVKRMEALERNAGGLVQGSADLSNFTFSLFPNPTSRFVTVDYTMYVDAPIGIELYNTFGLRLKLIVPQQNQKAGKYSVQLSVGDLGTGTYVVKATSGNQVESKQLVISQ